MLPPTIITAPTSAIARPNAASTMVTSEKRRSCSSASAETTGPAPSDWNCSAYSRHASATACRASAAISGKTSTAWAIDHRRGREQDAQRAQRARARQQEVDGQPDDDGGQARAARSGSRPARRVPETARSPAPHRPAARRAWRGRRRSARRAATARRSPPAAARRWRPSPPLRRRRATGCSCVPESARGPLSYTAKFCIILDATWRIVDESGRCPNMQKNAN